MEPSHRVILAVEFPLSAIQVNSCNKHACHGSESPSYEPDYVSYHRKSCKPRSGITKPLRLFAAKFERSAQKARTRRPESSPRLLAIVLQAARRLLVQGSQRDGRQ